MLSLFTAQLFCALDVLKKFKFMLLGVLETRFWSTNFHRRVFIGVLSSLWTFYVQGLKHNFWHIWWLSKKPVFMFAFDFWCHLTLYPPRAADKVLDCHCWNIIESWQPCCQCPCVGRKNMPSLGRKPFQSDSDHKNMLVVLPRWCFLS